MLEKMKNNILSFPDLFVNAIANYLEKKYPPSPFEPQLQQYLEDIYELYHVLPCTGRKKIVWTMKFEKIFSKKFYNNHLGTIYIIVCLTIITERFLETIVKKLKVIISCASLIEISK